MYQIEEPKYFYLFIAVAILLLFYLLNWLWKVKKQKEFADLALLNELSPQKSVFKPALKNDFCAFGPYRF